jgi:hypothetical protein
MPAPSTIVRHLGRVLHSRLHETLAEPLPERWVELNPLSE